MVIGRVPRHDIAYRFRTSGLNLNTGAFTTHLRVESHELANDIAEVYADYPIEDSLGVCDFTVHMEPPSPFRRYFRRQIQAYVEGEPPFQPLPAELAFPMLETTLNWCIAVRTLRYVMLHAGVVERNGRALVIPGPSGSGKSTLCAALTRCGWRLLSDEFALIRPQDGCLQPNPRPVSLKNEAIDIMARFAPHMRFSRPWHGTIKGTVAYMRPPSDDIVRARESASPVLVVFPSYRANAPTRLESLGKTAAFRRMVDNSVNYFSCLQVGFHALSGLAETCNAYALTYHALDDAIGLITGLFGEGTSTDAT